MLKFTITDYTTSAAGIATVIDEPVGWDGLGMRLKRSPGWHGIWDFFDDSYNQLQFDGVGGNILRAAYNLKGVEACVKILIEYACSETDAFQELYTGDFVFLRYNDNCGDRCFVECGVESTSCIMQFKNRIDQKVDLDSLRPFDNCDCSCGNTQTVEVGGGFDAATKVITITAVDGATPGDLTCLKTGQLITVTGTASNDGAYTVNAIGLGGGSTTITVDEDLVDEIDGTFEITGCLLPVPDMVAYDGLGKEIILPTKPILFKDDWGIPSGYTINYTDDLLDSEPIGIAGDYFFPLEWSIDNLTEIPDSYRNASIFAHLTSGLTDFLDETPALIDNQINPAIYCVSDVEIHIELDGSVHVVSDDTLSGGGTFILLHVDRNGAIIDSIPLTTPGALFCTNPSPCGFNINYTNIFSLAPGDRVYLYFLMTNVQYLTGGGGGTPADPFEFTLALSAPGIFTAASTSKCEPTPCKVYLINESLSRATEAITDDCLRVYSDYFGRTDAQPYTSESDGCGSHECITSGLHIRAKELQKLDLIDYDLVPKMTVSMKDMFDALNAIHNIGMGPEADPNRPGMELVRVEPFQFFYNGSVLMTCDHVKDVRREINPEVLFSIFKNGYEKWETENINGLNDVFGKREYRTALTQVKNTYERVCKFLASDYAIEVTRRQYGGTTKDWRYDNNTFIICLTDEICLDELIFEADDDTITATSTIINFQLLFDVGDTIVITGTGSNDGTYTITGIPLKSVIEVAEALTDETSSGCIKDTTKGLFIAEQGITDVGTSSIIYPEFCYNLRITPARNALRHFRTILMSYRDYLNGELIFTNGEGNSIAIIELLNTLTCIDEVSGGLAENGNITLDDFTTPADNYPLFRPERVKFDYPVTYAQYVAIRANPYGLIEFQCGEGPLEQGWIEDFQYKPYTGMGEFILKPKI